MNEPTLDRYGNLAYRWVVGGTQCTGTLYVAHAIRCCEAWTSIREVRQAVRSEPSVESSRPCCDAVTEEEPTCSRCGHCKPESTKCDDHCHRCCDLSLPF